MESAFGRSEKKKQTLKEVLSMYDTKELEDILTDILCREIVSEDNKWIQKLLFNEIREYLCNAKWEDFSRYYGKYYQANYVSHILEYEIGSDFYISPTNRIHLLDELTADAIKENRKIWKSEDEKTVGDKEDDCLVSVIKSILDNIIQERDSKFDEGASYLEIFEMEPHRIIARRNKFRSINRYENILSKWGFTNLNKYLEINKYLTEIEYEF